MAKARKHNLPKNQSWLTSWRSPYPLPNDTTKFILKHSENSRNQNLGLWLDRFVTWHSDKRANLVRKQAANKREVPMLSQAGKRLQWQGDLNLLKGIVKRWEHILVSYNYRDAFIARPEWRFVVGLGGATVLETGMTLHRIYGIPVVPGSSLKGIARAYAQTVEKAHEKTMSTIFGPSAGSHSLQAGEIIFFDAVPCTQPNFKLDIMNPHYPDYYQEKKPPADWQNPNPVYFLTVEKTEFLFAVAARRKEGKDHISAAIRWLKKGLAELGAGAKTAAGYGYFTEVE